MVSLFSFLFVENIVSGSSHMYECLCTFAVVLDSAELFHMMVPIVINAFHALAYVAVACLLLLLCYRCNVHIVCWMEQLCLSTCHRFEEIQFELVFQPL